MSHEWRTAPTDALFEMRRDEPDERPVPPRFTDEPRPEPPKLVIEPPDWREEERLAVERDAGEQPEPEPSRYPAKPTRRPKKTPNLDQVKAWQEGKP